MAREAGRCSGLLGRQRFVGRPAPPLRNPRHENPAALQPRPRRNHTPQRQPAAPHHAPALYRSRHRAGRTGPQRPGELCRGTHGRRPLPPDARRPRRHGPQGLFRGGSHRPPQRCLEHLRGVARDGIRGRRPPIRIPHGRFYVRHVALQRRRELLPHTTRFAQRGDSPGAVGRSARQFLSGDGGARAGAHGRRRGAPHPHRGRRRLRQLLDAGIFRPGSSAPEPTQQP